MKIIKKIATLLLAVCLTVPCFAVLTYAADGSIQFTDPSTAVGETLEVTGAVKTSGEAIGDADVNMTYDTSMLKFTGGDNVTETADGQLTYSGRGTGSGNELRFKMNFAVLKEGTTKIQVSGYKAWLYSDEKLDCQEGSSTITIAAGSGEAPSEEPEAPEETNTGLKVTVDGKEYEISEQFAEADIPAGYEETTMEYENAQIKIVQHETSGISLGYLVDENKIGEFFLYDSEDATFSPFEQITISETTVITLLPNKAKLKLPKEYQKVSLTLNEQEFTAWQNAEKEGCYILYAMNNQGEKAFYQFDSIEGTYQKFEVPAAEDEKADHSLFGKLNSFLEKHLSYVILGTGLGFIFFVVIVVVLGVKLHNRNVELDELYDEYGIDVEEEESVVQAEDSEDSFFEEEEFLDDETLEEELEEDFFDDDFEEDESAEEDAFEDDTFEDDTFEDDTFEDDTFEEVYEEESEFFDDDFDDEISSSLAEKLSAYDDFDVDFIDLDD